MPKKIRNMGTATMRFNEGIIVSGSIDTNYASKEGVAVVCTGSLEIAANSTNNQVIRIISNDSQREMVFDSFVTSGGSGVAAQLLGNGSKGLRIDASDVPAHNAFFKIDDGINFTFKFLDENTDGSINAPQNATQINIKVDSNATTTVNRIIAAINGDTSIGVNNVKYRNDDTSNRPDSVTATANPNFTNGITLTANSVGAAGNNFIFFTNNSNNFSVIQNINQPFEGGSDSGGSSSTTQETIASIFTESDDDLVISGSKEVHIRSGEGKAVMILSGTTGGATSPNPSNFTDTNFFVSGTIGSKGTSTKGTAVFGGDVVISGTLNGNTISFSTPGGSDGQVQYNNGGSLGGATNLFYNDSNDRVGIGTTSPDFRLDVAGNISINEKLVHNGDHDTFISYQNDVLSMSAGGVEFVTLEENPSQPSNFFVNKNFNDVDFSISGQGQANMDLFYVDASGGNVGFGTSEPEEGYRVHISGSAATYLLIGEGSGNQKSTSAAATVFHANRGLEFVTGSVGVTSPEGGIGEFILGTESSHDLEIRTGGVHRLFCSASGGVGIGTTTPTDLLTVNGAISLVESGITPNADSGYGKVYVKSSDSKLYFRNDSGTEFDLTLGASVAAGDDSNLLYNNGGAIGGANRLYYDDVNHRLGIKSAGIPTEAGVTLEVGGGDVLISQGDLIMGLNGNLQIEDATGRNVLIDVAHTGIGATYGTSLLNRGGISGNSLLLSSSADVTVDVGDAAGGSSLVTFKNQGVEKLEFNLASSDALIKASNGLDLESLNNSDIDLNSARDIVFKHSPGGGGTYTGFTFDISDTANGTTELRSPHDLTISNRLGNEKDITIDSDKDLNLNADQDIIVRCDNGRKLVISGSTKPSIVTGGSSVDGSVDTGILAIAISGHNTSYLALDENTVQAKTGTGDSAQLFINSFGGDVSISATNSGNVGIGDSSPSSKLNVKGHDGSVFAFKVEGNQNDAVLLASFVNDNTTTSADGIGISIGPDARSNMASGNKFIKLRDGDGTDCGFIEATSSGNVDITNAFTGGHPIGIVSGSYEIGSIIETSGDMWVKILDNVSDSFPYVNLCTSSNSKKVFGVICCTSWAEGKNPWAGTIARHPIKEGYQLAQCNSVGEGSIIVTNINGDIENGDYISSSEIAGYGQKQSDDILHNYTVAKCIEEVDWSTVTDTIDHEGVTYKKYLVACTYHCG